MPGFLLLLLVASVGFASGTNAGFKCSPPMKLSPKYLNHLVENSIGMNIYQFVSNFVPSVYFHGETVKFVSTFKTSFLNDIQLCVDGNTQSTPIQLYDDGTHGDDVAGDNVYSRDCVHFCQSYVKFADYWGYAFERQVEGARLVVIKPSLRGKIPARKLPNTLYPDATLLATSHAAFFVDNNFAYYPRWPLQAGDWWDVPTGTAHATSAVLSVFGDVFDFLTISSYEMSKAFPGASTWKWNKWDRQMYGTEFGGESFL